MTQADTLSLTAPNVSSSPWKTWHQTALSSTSTKKAHRQFTKQKSSQQPSASEQESNLNSNQTTQSTSPCLESQQKSHSSSSCAHLTMEKDKDIAEAVSLDSDTQTQLAASFEKAIGVDTPIRRHPIHRQPRCPRTSRRIPTSKSRNRPRQKLPPTLGQKRQKPQRKSHIPRRNGIPRYPTKNWQTPTRRQRPLQKQTSTTRWSTASRPIPRLIPQLNTRHKIPA